MSFAFKIILSYKGTHYCGWQTQTVNPNTIQQTLEETISPMVNFQGYQVIGASRTDKGVHANGQVVKLVLPKQVEASNLMKGLNTKLPADIRVLACCPVDMSFNPFQNVQEKEYHYFFSLKPIQSAALMESVYCLDEIEIFDLELLNKACELFRGEHDFKSFCTLGARSATTIREITHCSIEKANFSPMAQDVYYLRIESSGFLKYMVRFIMSSLIEVGSGRLSLSNLSQALNGEVQLAKVKKAPPHGLVLQRVKYLG